MRWSALPLGLAMLAAVARGAPVQLVINNGLAPPDPANVIDAAYDPFLFDVFVRNVGCGDEFPFDGPCALPGAATSVALVPGGVVNDRLEVFDSSRIEMSGGSVLLLGAYGNAVLRVEDGVVDNTLEAGGSASVSITGGSVEQFLTPTEGASVAIRGGRVERVHAAGSSHTDLSAGTVVDYVAAANGSAVSARWSGGSVGGVVEADGGSTIAIEGSGFELDGVPVPDGPLPPQDGVVCGTRVLSGTLASGEAFSNPVAHDGCYDAQLGRELTGTIVVPEPRGSAGGSVAALALAVLAFAMGDARPAAPKEPGSGPRRVSPPDGGAWTPRAPPGRLPAAPR
jgi:hypothetical protein